MDEKPEGMPLCVWAALNEIRKAEKRLNVDWGSLTEKQKEISLTAAILSVREADSSLMGEARKYD